MEWYYARGQEQVGPVSSEAFRDLVVQGIVREDTLVWNSGLPNWQPYGQVVNPNAAGAATPGHSAAAMLQCVECAQPFPVEHLVAYEGRYVCAACKPVFFQRIREGGTVATGVEYAGFWMRFVAVLIDGLITGIPMMIYMFVFMGAMFSTFDPEDPESLEMGFGGLFYLLAYAIPLIYSVFFLGKYGATPGKMALGLKVIRANGEKLTYGRAFGRYFANILSGMILYIGYIIVAFDDEKRALHDHICDTRVIKK